MDPSYYRRYHSYVQAVDHFKKFDNQSDAIIASVLEVNPDPTSKCSGYWFYVGTPEAISKRVVEKGYSAFKIFVGHSYLIMDIECYHPKTVVNTAKILHLTELLPEKIRDKQNDGAFIDENLTQAEIKAKFLEGVKKIVGKLVGFASRFYDIQLSPDDVAVDTSCSDKEGGKLSAHLHCPKLSFPCLEVHMKHFVYYFISETFPRMDLPWWMKESPRVLKPDERIEDKTLGGMRSLYYDFFDHFKNDVEWTRTCVDTLIYGKWRTLRVTGSSKNGQRILVPSDMTGYWTSQLGSMPGGGGNRRLLLTDENRLTWMSFMLGLRPHFSGVNTIRPQWPATRAKPPTNYPEPFNQSLYNPTRHSTVWGTFREEWVYAHNESRPRVKAGLLPPHLFPKKTVQQLFERPKILEFSQLPHDESRYLMFRHLVDLHEAAGFKDHARVNSILKDMAAMTPNVSYSVSDPIESLFAEKSVRVSADFEVRIPHVPDKVPLHSIHFKTSIFCPVHENGDSHNPSAYVGIDDKTGLRFIFCCVCSMQNDNRIVLEEEPPPKTDLKDFIPHTHVINADFLTMQHLELSGLGQIHTVIIKSPMGSGKTTLFRELFTDKDGLTLLKRLTGTWTVENNLKPISILAISPRELLTLYLAGCFVLDDHYRVCEEVARDCKRRKSDKWDMANKAMSETARLAICVGTLHRLRERKMEDQIVIMDEARMTMEYYTSEIGQKYARESIQVMQQQLKQSKLRIVIGAGTLCFWHDLTRTFIDLDIATLCALLPDTDLNDNQHILCIDNKGVEGGKSGIQGLIPYYTLDCQFALEYITEKIKQTHELGDGNVYFIPTNQYRHAIFLEKMIVEHTGIEPSKVFVITAQTPQDVKYNLIKDCKGYMTKKGYRVIIATPVFGTGFSIDAGYITHTFGFIFTYPIGNSNWVQMMARGRGPKSVGFFVEDAGLGIKKNVVIGGRTHKVDVSWLADKYMEKLAARKDGFVSYVENICTNGSSSIDDPYFEIMSQYIAIKKAEEEVERNVGAYHFIEELERVTGKKAQALSFLTQTRFQMGDEWKKMVMSHLHPSKIEKAVEKERLTGYTQRALNELQNALPETHSYEDKLALHLHKLSPNLIPLSMLPEPMRQKIDRQRVEMLIQLMLHAPRVPFVESHSIMHQVNYTHGHFVSANDARHGILPQLCNLVALIMRASNQSVYTMIQSDKTFFNAPIPTNIDSDGFKEILDNLRAWRNINDIGLGNVIKAANDYHLKDTDTNIRKVLFACLRALGLGTWTYTKPARKQDVGIIVKPTDVSVPERIKLAFIWYSIKEKVGYAKTLLVFRVCNPTPKSLWFFPFFPTEAEVDACRGSRPIQSFFERSLK